MIFKHGLIVHFSQISMEIRLVFSKPLTKLSDSHSTKSLGILQERRELKNWDFARDDRVERGSGERSERTAGFGGGFERFNHCFLFLIPPFIAFKYHHLVSFGGDKT